MEDEPQPQPTDTTLRRFCFAYAVTFSIVSVLFLFDAMHIFGRNAFYIMRGGLLLSLGIRVWITFELIDRTIQVMARTISVRRWATTTMLALLAWSPTIVDATYPLLPHYSFLWRHQDRFLRAIESDSENRIGSHFEHGSVFDYSWYTISDCCYAIIYEPNRPDGAQPLSRDTPRYYAGGLDFDLHLGGPWYAVRY